MTDPKWLARAARRAADRPFFLASALFAYARAEGLDEPALAARLGCAVESLPAILLCRRPTGDTFRQDVEQIAARFALDSARLAELLRLAEALEALGTAVEPAPTLLAAARDEEEAEE